MKFITIKNFDMNRNLSGVFYRNYNGSIEKWENIAFEDLPKSRQKFIVDKMSKGELSRLILILSKTLKEIGDEFDIIKN